jgi:hypothetical protein
VSPGGVWKKLPAAGISKQIQRWCNVPDFEREGWSVMKRIVVTLHVRFLHPLNGASRLFGHRSISTCLALFVTMFALRPASFTVANVRFC